MDRCQAVSAGAKYTVLAVEGSTATFCGTDSDIIWQKNNKLHKTSTVFYTGHELHLQVSIKQTITQGKVFLGRCFLLVTGVPDLGGLDPLPDLSLTGLHLHIPETGSLPTWPGNCHYISIGLIKLFSEVTSGLSSYQIFQKLLASDIGRKMKVMKQLPKVHFS